MARKIASGPDCWGFEPRGGKETTAMYLMRALEVGGKSRETIRSEYLYDFGKPVGASEAKSTFDVFLIDVQRPFGHAEASRSVIILTDPRTGHLSLDPTQAEISKNWVSRGILQRIRKVPGKFPPGNSPEKKDLRAIEAIREEFGVPLKK